VATKISNIRWLYSRSLALFAVGALLNCHAVPQSIDPPSPAEEIRTQVQTVLANHRRVPYRDAWSAVAKGASVPPNQIKLFYSRRLSFAQNRASGDNQSKPNFWNREHVWPQSYGLKNTPAAFDLHNLVPVDRTINSSRGNKPFDNADQLHHECADCRSSTNAWEPPDEVKGDIARILFYMDVRYDGSNGVPDLKLAELPNKSIFQFGRLSSLKRWHCLDAVSLEEQHSPR